MIRILLVLISAFSLPAIVYANEAESALVSGVDASQPVVAAKNITASQVKATTQAQRSPSSAGNRQQSTVLVDKIVAYVNKRIITQNELEKQIAQTRDSLQQRGITNTNYNDLRTRVLDQLILLQIQLDLAARGGIKTTDAEVNDAINNLEKAQGITDQQMRAKLARQGMSYDDFRQQLNDQITADKLKQREVDARVVVNDDEVTRILNSETYKNRIDYRLSDIVISIPEQATQDAVAKREALANQVYAQLKQGQSFEQLAIKYSSAPNALNGGDLGWKSNSSLPPIVLDPVAQTPQGGVTPVIKMPVGFFIFKVTGVKQHGMPQIVKQYHVRHILIKVNELTSDEEAHQKINSIRDQLIKDNGNTAKQNKDFIDLAKRYSEDTSSIKGGDIGWVSKGDTVPQFEQAMLKTPVGQISEPVRSPFGWHLLEVTETRDSNLANDKEKAEIRQELREMKAQMLYTEWVRNLREMAYVKLNDN